MNENFIKGLYTTIVQEGKSEYKSLLDDTKVEEATDKYWISALQLYDNLTEENREKLMQVIELVMIDTISSMLGIIDGSDTLSGCDAEPELYLDDVDTDGELQDLFLEYVEEMEEQIVNLTLNNLDNVVKEGKNGSINCVYYVYTLGF